VSQDILEELGAQIILGNTYHLYLPAGSRDGAKILGGLHGFIMFVAAGHSYRLGRVPGLQSQRTAQSQRRGCHVSLPTWDGSSHFFQPGGARWRRRSAWAPTSSWAFDECTELSGGWGRGRGSRLEFDGEVGGPAARNILKSTRMKSRGPAMLMWGQPPPGCPVEQSSTVNCLPAAHEVGQAAELRSAGQPGAAVPTYSVPTQKLIRNRPGRDGPGSAQGIC